MEKLIRVFVIPFLLFGLVNSAKATVISAGTGYEVSYEINMRSGGSNGSDIQNTFIFEWDDTNFNVDYAFTIAGQGVTNISHTIDFAPTSALIIGYGAGVAGVGDEKDHIYTMTSSTFFNTVVGLKWSQAFPGVDPNPRVGHSAMVSLLVEATTGDTNALNALTSFVTTEGYQAAFNPAAGLTIIEWSNAVGIPEPATLALMGLGLAGIGYRRHRSKKAA